MPSILVAVVMLAVAVIAEAQQPKKSPRIASSTWRRFRYRGCARRPSGRVCASLGYVEGKEIVIEYRYAKGEAKAAEEAARISN